MNIQMDVPGEREPPLYFAGRQDELDALGSKLHRLCATGDPSGGLQLTVGVLGVGKTQLAMEFANRVRDANIHGRKVAALRLSPEALGSPVDLFKAMACALDEQPMADQVAQHHDRVSSAAAGAFGARGALAIDIARHTPDLPGMLRESSQAGMWKDKALVLAVDELQRIDAVAMNALCVLHDGMHECPVLLLGFGLQHTERRLANPPDKRGISRIATPMVLTTLDDQDAFDAFLGNLSALGHADVPEESLDALAKASFGFPQHINGYLAGAHKALLRHGHLTGAALDAALRHGNERRTVYYNKRLAAGNSHEAMLALSSAMESANATAVTYGEAKAAMESAGFDLRDLDTAIEHGVVVHGDDDNVSFGIPSFHSHMAALHEHARRKAAARLHGVER